MTQASLIAELNYLQQAAEFDEQSAARHRARAAEIEQQLADMGCGLLRERTVNVSLPIGYVKAGQALMVELQAEQIADTPLCMEAEQKAARDHFARKHGLDPVTLAEAAE